MVQLKKSLLAILLVALPAFSYAQQSMDVQRVASGLSSPVFVTYAPGDSTRLFIVQRSAQIRILNLTTGNLNGQNFMTVPGVLAGGGQSEQGLLGLAFHPDYQKNGRFFVYFTDNTGGDARIQQFTRIDEDTADATSAVNIIEIDEPQSNHNGGWLGFDDGYLYASVGDGGAANDSGSGHTAGTGNAQDITNNLRGKMLRLDIDGDDFPADPNLNYAIPADNPFVGVTGDDEIFLYGLRNPWRCSFDRLTGDLWIGDVGQDLREEIDVYLNDSDADKNYGWRLREGMFQTPGVGGTRPADNVDPVYDYPRGGAFGGRCTTGGYVYRGPIEELQGHYLFGDYVSGRVWSFKYDGTTPFDGTNYRGLRDWTNIIDTDIGIINSISSFGEDADGNLYIVDLGGEIFKVVNASLTTVVNVTGVNAIRGFNIGGSANDLQESDDVYLVYQQGPVLNPSEPPVWLEFSGTSPDTNPETFSFCLESQANTVGLVQTIELFNYDTGAYEVMSTGNASFRNDSKITIDADGDVGRFISDTGAVKAKATWKSNGPVLLSPWKVSIDQAVWRIIE